MFPRESTKLDRKATKQRMGWRNPDFKKAKSSLEG